MTPGPLDASDDEAPRYRSSNEGRHRTHLKMHGAARRLRRVNPRCGQVYPRTTCPLRCGVGDVVRPRTYLLPLYYLLLWHGWTGRGLVLTTMAWTRTTSTSTARLLVHERRLLHLRGRAPCGFDTFLQRPLTLRGGTDDGYGEHCGIALACGCCMHGVCVWRLGAAHMLSGTTWVP